MRCRIGFDIDGVIANFMRSFLDEYISPHCKREVNTSELTQWHFYTCLDEVTKEDEDRLFQQAMEDGMMERLKILDNGILPILVKTQDRMPIVYVTSRHPLAVPQTYKWFMNNQIPFGDGIYFETDGSLKKSDFALALNMVAFVEDSLDNAIDVASGCPNVFLYDRRYNQGSLPSNVHRFRTGQELERILEPTVRAYE